MSNEGYLNVNEIETFLINTANHDFPNITKLIKLPYKTHEDRTCYAIRIGCSAISEIDEEMNERENQIEEESIKGRTNKKVGLLLLGGMHGREWGGSDILIYFIQILLEAYSGNMGISLETNTSSKSYSNKLINVLKESLEIFIFPMVNPDGKALSQAYNEETKWRKDWRKNRAPTNCDDFSENWYPGVDLNRNFDFLWDFRRHMHIDAQYIISDEPCSIFYCGTEAFSEPETKNVKWVLDKYPYISYFVDIHSAGGRKIFYPWWDSMNQNQNPNMNFMEEEYDEMRGELEFNVGEEKYKEYIPKKDERKFKRWGEHMSQAIQAAIGEAYSFKVDQPIFMYPATGTSMDYAYSRYFSGSSQTKIFPFTIEFSDNPYPDYETEMIPLMKGVSMALFEFCYRIAIDAKILCPLTEAFSSSSNRITLLQLNILRNWRDTVFGSSFMGRQLIRLYYERSQQLSLLIANSKIMKRMIQVILKPLITSLYRRHPKWIVYNGMGSKAFF